MINQRQYLQSWTKVLGTVLQYSYFSVISRFPLKTERLSRNFLVVPPPYRKLKLGKNFEYTRPTLFVGWGEGLDLCEWKTPQKSKSVPRLLSMIVDLGSDASSVWNFCSCYLDVISRGNHSWCREMSAVFSGYKLNILTKKKLWMNSSQLSDKEICLPSVTFEVWKLTGLNSLKKTRLQSVLFFQFCPSVPSSAFVVLFQCYLTVLSRYSYISFNLVANFYKEKDNW